MNKGFYITLIASLVLFTNFNNLKPSKSQKYVVVFDQLYCKECVNELLVRYGKNEVYQGAISTGNILRDSMTYYNMLYDRPDFNVLFLPKSERLNFDTVRQWPLLIEINQNLDRDTVVYFYFQLFDRKGDLRTVFLDRE